MKFRATALRSTLAITAVTVAVLSTNGCKRHERAHHKPTPNTTTDAELIHRLASSPALSTLRWPKFSPDQSAVQKFYADRDGELAWTRHDNPTPQATALLQLFHDAALKGLNPQDYDAGETRDAGSAQNPSAPDRWAPRLQQLDIIAHKKDDSSAAHNAVATFDVAMTLSAIRYLEDLHLGRINPESLNFDIDVPARRAAFDVATLLNEQIVDAKDVPAAVAAVEPQSPIYQATERALPTYIAIAAAQTAAPTPPLPALPAGEKPVAVNGHYASIPQLGARLQIEGDATASEAPAASDGRYNAQLAAAVKHFQQRHGLQPDGRLGQATIDALNVPLSARVRQIDDALERWRWLPENYSQPRVFVNLPEFMLRAYDPSHELDFKMKVVDGEVKGDHDTPMFVRLMRYVVFRPYWNLPPSIVKKELMPHIRRSGLAYLADNDYEAYKADGTVVTKYTVHDIEHARYGIRQKPGPKNSLGLVKFLFPNVYDVYMHSTPELNLFDLTRRDRSHGCVRLQHADQMALWVLYGDQRDPEAENGWDADKVDLAMSGDLSGDLNNHTVGLRTPLPVLIGYFTAMPDEDGTMHFFNDLYSYDKQLEAALAKGRPYERVPVPINTHLTPGETE